MILGVIPARYGATRFPGKALALLRGKPLVEWVWRRAAQARRLDRLLIATDDERIQAAAAGFGAEVVMTPSDLASGTDRVWAAAKGTPAELVVNIQGDEPLLSPEMVDRLAEHLLADPEVEMATFRYGMRVPEGYADPNVVKVVADPQGWALYFSRSPLPGRKEGHPIPSLWYKHIGLYAYRRRTLERFVGWPASCLEQAEGLEQLRALEHGVKIKVLDSSQDTIGVDTPEDLHRVDQILAAGA